MSTTTNKKPTLTKEEGQNIQADSIAFIARFWAWLHDKPYHMHLAGLYRLYRQSLAKDDTKSFEDFLGELAEEFFGRYRPCQKIPSSFASTDGLEKVLGTGCPKRLCNVADYLIGLTSTKADAHRAIKGVIKGLKKYSDRFTAILHEIA